MITVGKRFWHPFFKAQLFFVNPNSTTNTFKALGCLITIFLGLSNLPRPDLFLLKEPFKGSRFPREHLDHHFPKGSTFKNATSVVRLKENK